MTLVPSGAPRLEGHGSLKAPRRKHPRIPHSQTNRIHDNAFAMLAIIGRVPTFPILWRKGDAERYYLTRSKGIVVHCVLRPVILGQDSSH